VTAPRRQKSHLVVLACFYGQIEIGVLFGAGARKEKAQLRNRSCAFQGPTEHEGRGLRPVGLIMFWDRWGSERELHFPVIFGRAFRRTLMQTPFGASVCKETLRSIMRLRRRTSATGEESGDVQ